MADDVGVLPSFEPEAVNVATDDVAGRHYQWMKPAFGPDGTAISVDDVDGDRLPVDSPALGFIDDVAAGTDTADTSLIGLFKRLLQRITSVLADTGTLVTTVGDVLSDTTSLIARLPATVTTNGAALKTGASEVVLTASVAAGATVQATGLDVGGLHNWGILVPSTFDGTQIQFQTCDSFGGTYVGVYDITNTRVTMTVAAGRFYDIPGELMAIRFLKIECVTAQAGTATDFLIIGKT